MSPSRSILPSSEWRVYAVGKHYEVRGPDGETYTFRTRYYAIRVQARRSRGTMTPEDAKALERADRAAKGKPTRG